MIDVPDWLTDALHVGGVVRARRNLVNEEPPIRCGEKGDGEQSRCLDAVGDRRRDSGGPSLDNGGDGPRRTTFGTCLGDGVRVHIAGGAPGDGHDEFGRERLTGFEEPGM